MKLALSLLLSPLIVVVTAICLLLLVMGGRLAQIQWTIDRVAVPIDRVSTYQDMLEHAQSGDLFLIESGKERYLRLFPNLFRPVLNDQGEDTGFTHVCVVIRVPPHMHLVNSRGQRARLLLYSSTSACIGNTRRNPADVRLADQCVHLQDIVTILDDWTSVRRLAWRRIREPLDVDEAYRVANAWADPEVVHRREPQVWCAAFLPRRMAPLLVTPGETPTVCSGTVSKYLMHFGLMRRGDPFLPYWICPISFANDRCLSPLLHNSNLYEPLRLVHWTKTANVSD